MPKISYKEAILMAVMEEGYLNTHGISLLKDDLSFLQKQTYELTKKGLLADKQFPYSIGKRQYLIKYKVITKAGVEYAKNHWSDKYTWLKYLPSPLPDFQVRVVYKPDTFYRQLLSATASVLFNQFGLETLCVVKSNDYKKINYKQLVYNAKVQDKKLNDNIKTLSVNDLSDNYIHSNDIYPLLNARPDEEQQILFTQQIGFLLYGSNSYIIYSGKKSGITISYTMLQRVRGKLNALLQKNRLIAPNQTLLSNGIILCDTLTSWKKSILSGVNVKHKEKVGMYLKHLYCFPIRRELVYILDKILYYGNDFEKIVIDTLLKSDKDVSNSITLKYRDMPLFIGIDMDIVKLHRLFSSMRSNPDSRYVIVCLPWQEQYYKKILPEETTYYHIEDYQLAP